MRSAIVGLALLWTLSAAAQSGRGSMKGYVSLDDQAPMDPVHAHVTLHITRPGESIEYKADTSERGLFEIPAVMMGEYRLKISAPGYRAYETTLYVPSDFLGNIAVVLKKDRHSTKKGDAP